MCVSPDLTARKLKIYRGKWGHLSPSVVELSWQRDCPETRVCPSHTFDLVLGVSTLRVPLVLLLISLFLVTEPSVGPPQRHQTCQEVKGPGRAKE